MENDADLVRLPDDIFKVWPTNANQQAFRTVMKSQDGVGSEIDDRNNLVQEAYVYFDTTIAEWAAEFSGNRALLEEQFDVLTAVVRQLLKVVVIDLDPNDNAQVIFETLNARGTPLLAIDLVKNLVFERAQVQGANVEDLYRDQWQPFDSGYWRGDVRQGRLNLRCAESPSHRASDRQKGLLGLISQDKLRPALRATLRHADLETSSAQAARWYSLISPWRRC